MCYAIVVKKNTAPKNKTVHIVVSELTNLALKELPLGYRPTGEDIVLELLRSYAIKRHLEDNEVIRRALNGRFEHK